MCDLNFQYDGMQNLVTGSFAAAGHVTGTCEAATSTVTIEGMDTLIDFVALGACMTCAMLAILITVKIWK